ncbi:hypothetical protein PHYC_02934 [Phycisphaerales bacterium]|nr:hypothetical protein PHYC_02934 [Phycisphaerales bacterium]
MLGGTEVPVARRKQDTLISQDTGVNAGLLRAGVLIVASRKTSRDALLARVGPAAARVEACDAEAAPKVARGFDLVVVDCPHPLDVWEKIERANPGAACVVLRESPDAAFLGDALRRGVTDVLDAANAPGIVACLGEACARVQRAQGGLIRERRRARRLRALCGNLFRSRHELMKQMGDLCADMARSYRDLSDQLSGVSMVSEFNAILRQELDIEGLLRTTLEYTLKKVGATNAAIFLPNSLGDYSLGAYVNYDCAKDSCESLLDHLADVAAPAFEAREDAVVMRDFEEVTAALGREADWLTDSTMVAVPCRREGECLAVTLFFRDRRTPFSDANVHSLRQIAELFGEQLSRVIKTHNRHLPKDKWNEPGDVGPDDIDLAA